MFWLFFLSVTRLEEERKAENIEELTLGSIHNIDLPAATQTCFSFLIMQLIGPFPTSNVSLNLSFYKQS